MAITYEWKTQSMSCYPTYEGEQYVVFTVSTMVTAIDDSSPKAKALTGLTTDIPYVPTDPYIPYADLTPEIVNGWVQEVLGADQVTAIQSGLDAQIADILNPPIVSPALPWSA